MTLDEAIKHCKEKAEELKNQYGELANKRPEPIEEQMRLLQEKHDCLACANEHEQLAEWLEDYKRLLEEKVINVYPNGDVIVQNIRPKGKWELHGKTYYCSECGEEAIDLEPEPDVYSSSYCLTDYCPNCGADMRGKEE